MIMQWWNNAEMEKELRNMEYVNLITWFSFEIHICAAFCSNRIFVEIVHFFSHSHYSHRSSFTSYWHGYGGIVSLMKRNEFKPKHRKCSLWNETRVKSIQTSWQTDVTSIVWHWAIIIVGWCKIELCIRTYARKWNNLNMTTGMNILWNGNSTKYYKENVSSRSSIGKKKQWCHQIWSYFEKEGISCCIWRKKIVSLSCWSFIFGTNERKRTTVRQLMLLIWNGCSTDLITFAFHFRS